MTSTHLLSYCGHSQPNSVCSFRFSLKRIFFPVSLGSLMFFQLFLLGGLVKFPWKCVCVCLPCEFGGRVPVQ